MPPDRPELRPAGILPVTCEDKNGDYGTTNHRAEVQSAGELRDTHSLQAQVPGVEPPPDQASASVVDADYKPLTCTDTTAWTHHCPAVISRSVGRVQFPVSRPSGSCGTRGHRLESSD
jgi:hypothetical protein